MRFEKTIRERLPRKIKKQYLKCVSRLDYSNAVHLRERYPEEQGDFYIRFYDTPFQEVDAMIAEMKESAKNQTNHMTKEEEIAYIIGDTSIGQSLIDKINQM